MRTVSTDELPSRLDVFVTSDSETRNHDHYNKFRGGVEWECELNSKEARMGCYSDMLKRMRGMLPANWTVSKAENNPELGTTTATIGPQENVDDPAMKSNMTEQKLREAIRSEIRKLDEIYFSNPSGGRIEVKSATSENSGIYIKMETRSGSAHMRLNNVKANKLADAIKAKNKHTQ